MFAQPTDALREELLGLAGIGPETADSILLYAANREVFVVDSYTRRIFGRHGLAKVGAPYEEIPAGSAAGDDRQRCPAAKPESRRGQGQGQPPRREASKAGTRSEDGPRAVASHRPSPASAMARSELSQRYNEFHALLVQTGKHYCLKGEPRCEHCPLRRLLEGKPIPLG